MSKTVFITGGSKGIGRATVKKFYNEGYNVAFTDINKAKAEELIAELPEKERVIFIQADTKSLEEMEQAAKQVHERFGAINNLVCNAGIHRCNTMLDISTEEFDLIVKTNIYGTFHTLRAVVPYIVDSGGGSVVLNDSDQWFVGKPNSFAYGLTKGAIGQITRSLAVDLGPKGIRVNAVCAGTIKTDLVNDLFKDFARVENKKIEEYWDQENGLYARGSAGEPEEVAELIYFLASEKASFCTGGHYLCDGGLVAR